MVRIGVLTPSSNTVLEPETARLLAPIGDASRSTLRAFR